MGQVLTDHAMKDAIRRAKAHGIARRRAAQLQPFRHGALLHAAWRRAPGCVAFLSTNASPAMAPWGGRKKTVGTNPWSWAAPGRQVRADGARHRQHRRGARQDLPRQAEGPADPARAGRSTPRARRPPIRRGDRRHHPADGRPQGLRDRRHDGHAVGRADRQRLRRRRRRPVPDRAPERRGADDDRARHRGVPAARPSSTRAWSS